MAHNVLPLTRLIEQFERLPGVGRKGAQRLAFYVLGMSKDQAKAFADAVVQAHEKIKKCGRCQDLTDGELCHVCTDKERDGGVICVVESPRDVMAFERTREYKGCYHVLHGLMSPMEGIGPEQLTVRELISRMGGGEVREVIMATSPTVEGEATAMYLARLIKPMGIKVSRLAYGIPVGGNLEYADEVTLFRALEGRNEL